MLVFVKTKDMMINLENVTTIVIINTQIRFYITEGFYYKADFETEEETKKQYNRIYNFVKDHVYYTKIKNEI